MSEYVYVDVNLNQSDNITAGPRPLTRQILRTTPIVPVGGQWDVIVNRLILNSCLMPIWIPQLTTTQDTKTTAAGQWQTVYSVGLRCRISDPNSGAETQYIASAPIFLTSCRRDTSAPQGRPIGNDKIEIKQPKSAFCHIYDPMQIIEMFNQGLTAAYIQLDQTLRGSQWAADFPNLYEQLEAPYMVYDPTQQNMKILAKPYVLWQNLVEGDWASNPYMYIEITFSASCYPLLQGFYCMYDNLNTKTQTPYDIVLKSGSQYNQTQAAYLTLLESGGPTAFQGPSYQQGPPFQFIGQSKMPIYNNNDTGVPTVMIFQQSYPGAMWSNLTAVQKIILITDMPIRVELTDDDNYMQNAPTAGSSSQSVMCDFFPDNLSAGSSTSLIVYNSATVSTGRRINLLTAGAITQFTISAYWVDAYGNQFPLLTTDASRPSMVKLVFIKKTE